MSYPIDINFYPPDTKGCKITVNVLYKSRTTGMNKTEQVIVFCLHPENAIIEACKQFTDYGTMQIRPSDMMQEYYVLAAWVV